MSHVRLVPEETSRRLRLQDEIALHETVERAGEIVNFDLEIGFAIAVDVALDQHMIAADLVVKFAGLVVELLGADEVEGLIAESLLGVDAVDVDVVAVTPFPLKSMITSLTCAIRRLGLKVRT